MTEPAMPHLTVKLRDLTVGEMTLHGNSVRFAPDPAYLAARPRPILGQIFEDDPERIRPTHHRLAPWFSKDFGSVTPATFRRFGDRIGYPRPAELEKVAGEFADTMRTVWSSISADLPLVPETIGVIDERLHNLPLAGAA